MKLISWNIGGNRQECWAYLAEKSDADIALLQEANQPPSDIGGKIDVNPGSWTTPMHGAWRAAVANLSKHVEVKWIETECIEHADTSQNYLPVSLPGTLAAAEVKLENDDPIVVISMYAPWKRPLASTGSEWIYADASAHRIISDISAFIGQERRHRIIAAGDLNILYGYGEHGSDYWADRHKTVFNRMEALGLKFVGPQHPHGRQAAPWPSELPADSLNVPTFYHRRQSPETASRQLDFVFASKSIADQVKVRALNDPAEWGPSDHCQIEIEL